MLKMLGDSNRIIRIFFEGIRYFILTIIIVGLVTEKIYFQRIVLFNFIILILSNVLGELLKRKYQEANKFRKIISIIGILISIIFGFYSTYSNFMFIVFIIIYLYVWIQGLRMNINIDGTKDIITKIVFTSLTGFLFTIEMFFGHIRWYMEKLLPYLLIFLMISLVYLVRTNIYNAYDSMNFINKKKNLKKFNMLSNIVIVVFIIIIANMTLVFFDLGMINNKIFPITDMILNSLILLVSVIIKAFSIVFTFFKINNDYEVPEWNNKKSNNNEMEQILEQNVTRQMLLSYLGWCMVVLIIIIIGYIIYRLTKDIEKLKEDKEQLIEEKEFIINRRDIINSIANKIKNKKEKYNSKNINKVQQLFIDLSLSLINKGYKYKKEYTPREFLNQKSENFKDVEGFVIEYEKVRYGNELVTDDKIEKMIKYKNKIDKK
ncbi:hypothetical protein GOQ29_03385 [Clostridium sp. D2Q-14]|uniref:hypothetical protein n=1 Tax=Anaeromonas gelatinilytica TaxID=2683194 RepID=UPI00193C36FB|nr:hypothetical protein [Anaeromonas gelatinilytica]MBS4534653.1 hypothetical protein [Anaeromonas gelatinilytica]